MGISLNKKGINSKDTVNKIFKGRQIVGCLNSLWWDKNISLDTKKRLGKAMVEQVACYGCEVWLLKTEEQRKQVTKNSKHHHQEQNASRTINFRQSIKEGN